MKNYKLTFDSTSPYWEQNSACNRMFIAEQDAYFNRLLKHRGYIYLNKIYEDLGIGWDPKKANPCFTKDEYKYMLFSVNEVTPYVYEITIYVH